MGGDEEIVIVYPDNHDGLSSAEAAARLAQFGRNELPEKSTPGWIIFVRCLWGPMPIALWIAIIIEFSLQNWPDGAILLAIQFGNATIGWYETTKAGDAVAALKQSLKPRATVFRDGQWQDTDACTIVPGDKVKLASGSAIPADCTINDEPHALCTPQIDVDEAALTGESLPVTMTPKTHIAKMGSTCVRGEVDGTVQFTGTSTVFGKTALLLQAVEADLGNIHYVLVKVMYGLTGLAMGLCIICFIFLMAYHHTSFKAAIEFTVVLLVVSIPIAIEIVVTTTLALGSKELSAKKVIVTRLSAIEMMAAVNMLCSDKTGTLTLNKMEIQQDCPIFTTGEDRESVLVYSALAAKWREPPRDALDTMVLGAANLDRCDKYKQLDYKPFDPRVKRTEAVLVGPDGVQFKVTKGAPNIVLQLCANSNEIRARVEGIITDLGGRGIRCLAVARTFENEEWYMLGILTFLDPPRPDTKVTIENAKKYGVDVKMVTGDHVLIAKEMARMLNMGTNIQTAQGLPHFPESGDPKDIPDTLGDEYGDMIAAMDGFAQVHPEHKYLIVETLRQRGFTCAMTGDGVNDAPALKRADVGIAVHGSTDAARAASDMVLTEPGLSVIVDAMLIARGVFQRMLSFLTYRVSATLQLVFFFFIAVFALPPKNYGAVDPEHPEEAAFFHLPVLMFMLITLLNDGTLMAIGYDRVVPQPRPQRWNLRALFFIAAVLAGVACVSSLMLLWMTLDSIDNYENSWFYKMGLPPADYPHIISAVYLKVSISDFLTLFAARTQTKPFFAYAPSKVLLIGACGSLMVSTVVGSVWPTSSPDDILTVGLARLSEGQPEMASQRMMPIYVWLYCIAWWFVQDWIKVLSYVAMDRFNIFQYRTFMDPDTPAVAPTVQRHSDTASVNEPLISKKNSVNSHH
jgi:H+-transporting ATPase